MDIVKVCVVNPFNNPFHLPPYYEVVDKMTDADVILSLGGDGTLLSAFREMRKQNVDLERVILVGVNRGTLGFMANETENVFTLLAHITPMHLKNLDAYPFFEKRQLLKVTVSFGENKEFQYKVLNEVALHSCDLGRLFIVDLCVTVPSIGIYDSCLTYKGDGVVVATPTGSTAYNLSVNGPIMMPRSEGIIVSPISPFSLSSRPIIMSNDAVININFKQMNALIHLDGNALATGAQRMRIEADDVKLRLFRTENFLTAIRTKLGWNGSIK